jgi:hypothetical protein
VGRLKIAGHGGYHSIVGIHQRIETKIRLRHSGTLEHVEMHWVLAQRAEADIRVNTASWIEGQLMVRQNGRKARDPGNQRLSATTEAREVMRHDPAGQNLHFGFEHAPVEKNWCAVAGRAQLDHLISSAIMAQTPHLGSQLRAE